MDPPTDPTAAILFRLLRIEEDIKDLQQKFSLYVTERENDLRINNLLEAVTRVGVTVQEVRDSHKALAQQLAAQQENQNKIQIRILATTVTTFISILVSVFIGYITHFFH